MRLVVVWRSVEVREIAAPASGNKYLLADLVAYLQGGDRKIDRWLERHAFRSVDFTDREEMFLNVNTPVDLQAATTWLQQNETDSGG